MVDDGDEVEIIGNLPGFAAIAIAGTTDSGVYRMILRNRIVKSQAREDVAGTSAWLETPGCVAA